MNKSIKILSTIIVVLLVANVTNATLWNFYKSEGVKFPSISERAEIAENYGIFDYSGTAEQNLLFLDLLLEDKNEEPKLGYAAAISDYQTTLTGSLTSTAQTIAVSSVVTTDGVTLTTDIIYPGIFLTLDPANADDREIAFCPEISGTSFTNCDRGLSFSATSTQMTKYATTSAYIVTANQNAHPAGVDIIASNPYQFYQYMFPDRWSDELIWGVKTFASNTIGIGDDDSASTLDKCLYLENGVTNRPYICYDESEDYWIISADGTSSFQLTPTSTVISAGKNLDLTAGVMDMQTSVYIPDLNASTTIISGGSSVLGFWGPEGNLNASGTLLIDGIFTPSGGISTSTLNNVVIGESTASNAWFDKLHASSTTQGALLDLLTVYATTTLSGIGADLIVQGVSTSTFLGNFTVDWSVGFGSFASSTRALTNGSIDFGAYDGAWRDIYTSGTLYIYNIEADGSISSSSTATSTFQGGMQATQFDATGSATNTFANGIKLNGGCFEDASGNCVNSGILWQYISSNSGTAAEGVNCALVSAPAGSKAVIIRAYPTGNTVYGHYATLTNIGSIGASTDGSSTTTILANDNAAWYNMPLAWNTTTNRICVRAETGVSGGDDSIDYTMDWFK